jgi:hypothetical protein
MSTATMTLAPATAIARESRVDQRGRVPGSLDALAAVLAVGCAIRLRAIAERGGPSPEAHAEELRRLLVRREGRRAGLARRRQIRHAIEAAASGRPGAIAPGDRQALVRDLRELERALVSVDRAGAVGDGVIGR